MHEVVGRTSKSIAMSASLDFLGDQLNRKYGEKPLLISNIDIHKVVYKLKSFASLTTHHNVCM